MSHVEKSIDVNVPLSTAYNQWTQFEEFPQFMDSVREVRQLSDHKLHWRANIGGKDVEWDAEISQQIPDKTIAWRNTNGARNEGQVDFERLAADMTRVSLQLDYDTDGFLEAAADRLGFITRLVEGDLVRFKQFIEIRGQETGAWRGEIAGSEATPGSEAIPGSEATPVDAAAPATLGADYAGEKFAGPSAEGVSATGGSFEGLPAQGAPVVIAQQGVPVAPSSNPNPALSNLTADSANRAGLSATGQALADPSSPAEPLPTRPEGFPVSAVVAGD